MKSMSWKLVLIDVIFHDELNQVDPAYPAGKY